MQTLKLWLEDDPDIPELKKLAFEVVDVDIQDILQGGVHPWSDHQANRTLREKFTQVLNSNEVKVKELVEYRYCEDLDTSPSHYSYGEGDSFDALVKRINQHVRFVDAMDYRTLLAIAVRELRRKWDQATAKQLAQSVCCSFNDLRSFIKAKNRDVKLSSYGDVDQYNLGEILSLEDFQTEDKLLIREGLPVDDFRLNSFLQAVTNERGLLRLVSSIDHFQLASLSEETRRYRTLSYRCSHNNGTVRLIPSLRDDDEQRHIAKMVAERWRTDNGRYCFTTTMTKLREMISTGGFEAGFSGLDYMRKPEPAQAAARVQRHDVQCFSIGRYLTESDCGDRIKAVLREHGVSMTGTKEQLADKLAQLSVKLYRRYEGEAKRFFRDHRFVRIENGHRHNAENLPVLREIDQRNMLLAMFATRHLRGNTILDAAHENDTYELIDLARSLIKGEVSISGAFLKVED